METPQERIKKLALASKFPHLVILEETEKLRTELSELLDIVREFRGVDWNSIKGEQGDSITGPQGIQGERGEQGIQGERGDDGDEGYTPIKGKDYFDGEKGEKQEIDEEKLISSILKKIQLPENGKDADEDSIIEKVIKKMKPKKYGIKDIDGLEKYLVSIQDVMRNLGGHGGTTQVIKTTTTDNQTFNLSPAPSLSETALYRGGGRIFSENGDYTYTLIGNKLKTITLATPLNDGEYLNIYGKQG